MKKVSHSYYVCMCDFGRRGLEATVQPEITRREVVSRIKSGEYKDIEFIHFIDGLFVEDLTAELKAEAEIEHRNDALLSPADIQSAAFDRVRDLVREQMS